MWISAVSVSQVCNRYGCLHNACKDAYVCSTFPTGVKSVLVCQPLGVIFVSGLRQVIVIVSWRSYFLFFEHARAKTKDKLTNQRINIPL